MTIQQARTSAELSIGRKLDDQTFNEVLAYTRRKARITGHDENYIPLLLMDEIKGHVSRAQLNTIACEMAAFVREFRNLIERGEWPCVKSASEVPA